MYKRSRTTSRLRRFLALAATGAFLLGGCQALPREGTVEAGLSNLQQGEETVLFNPASPLPGASPEEIARGFLAAASSATDNYGVAREYLAPRYAYQWQPSTGVIIDDGVRSFETTSDTSAELTVTPIASVTAGGLLTPQPVTAPSKKLHFEFVRVNDEWRISAAPSGILLDRSTFTAVWEQHQLAFISDTGDIVWEQRWFLNDATLFSNVVRQLIAGPTGALRAGSHTAFESDTELASNVTVLDGEAVIELSTGLTELHDSTLAEIERQLAATLGNYNSISTFKVLSDAQTVLSGSVTQLEISRQEQAHYVLVDNQLREIDAGELLNPHPLNDVITRLEPRSVSLQLNEEKGAVLAGAGEGAYLVSAEGAQLVDSRAGVLAPVIDKWGYVWSAAAASSSEIYATNGAETSLRFQLPAVDTSGLDAIRVSPDGSKLALLVNADEGTEIYIAGIGRSAEGVPAVVSAETVMVAQLPGKALDIDWIDGVRLASLTQHPTSSGAVVTFTGIGFFPTERGTVPNGRQLVGIDRATNMRVLTSEGRLYRPQGASRWELVISGVQLLTKWG